MAEFDPGGEIVWKPNPHYTAGSHLERFMHQHGLNTWDELYERSIHDVAWFTAAMLNYLDIQFYEPYDLVLDSSRGKPWARWCVGGKMNIVHNCLDKWMGTPQQNMTALRYEGEEGNIQLLTYGDLFRQVNRLANGLRALGLGKGDTIGLYLPMTPEVAIALLAIAKIGGIILPLFSGYGAGAVATRLADAQARALFTADGFFRRGHAVDMKRSADEAISLLSSDDAYRGQANIQHLIVARRTGQDVSWVEGRDIWWDHLISDQPLEAATERTDAEDRVMIIYTSGTTGRPKGAVHTHCGFPLKAAMDMALGLDLRRQDTLYWMTDMGWMMGPWEVFGALVLGSSMVFYDGAPDYPGVDRLWQLVEDHGITTLGVSPTLIRALMQDGEQPVRSHDLRSLRVMGSTGEPWNPEPWLWLFNVVGEGRCPIINYSGGTEISGGIVMGNVMKPLKPCAFSGPVPGMAADVVDEEGHSIRGQVGELVVREPWIGMTRGFWQDPKRYLESYWNRFPDVWVHGDWAAVDADGLWYILGRSDDTIKVAGKRLGPAEVETVLVHHPAVVEGAAIGVPDKIKGQALVVFCVLALGYDGTEPLAAELRDLVAEELGKPLAPKAVHFVPDLPKTRNAKVMRRVLRAAYLGEHPGDLSALVNPEVLDAVMAVGA